MDDDADLPAVVGDARLPLRVREGRRERGERARALFEAFGERVAWLDRVGVTSGSHDTTVVINYPFVRARVSARRVLTVRRGPLSAPCARVRFA